MSSDSDEREMRMHRLAASLQNFIRGMEAAQERAAKKQHLHPTDFSCLGLLYRSRSPISPKHIIATLGLTSGSGTALLDRLEAHGYIKRIPNPEDRRSVLIELDREKAAEPLARYREIENRYRQATKDFSDRDLEMITAYLEKIVVLSSTA